MEDNYKDIKLDINFWSGLDADTDRFLTEIRRLMIECKVSSVTASINAFSYASHLQKLES